MNHFKEALEAAQTSSPAYFEKCVTEDCVGNPLVVLAGYCCLLDKEDAAWKEEVAQFLHACGIHRGYARMFMSIYWVDFPEGLLPAYQEYVSTTLQTEADATEQASDVDVVRRMLLLSENHLPSICISDREVYLRWLLENTPGAEKPFSQSEGASRSADENTEEPGRGTPEGEEQQPLPESARPQQQSAQEKPFSFPDISEKYRSLYAKLTQQVLGQDVVISGLVEGLFRTEIRGMDKTRNAPRAVFLFTGPPGVGKTLLAECAAKELGLPYRRLNMSEYASESDYFQLTGSDESYRNGHQGLLTTILKKHSKCVLIFDEIEKAGNKVHNIFLQILGSGEYDDDYLKETISCRDTIMIFTSNAGKSLYDSRKDALSLIPKTVVMNAIEKEKKPDRHGEEVPLFPLPLCSRFGSGEVLFFDRIGPDILQRLVRRGFDAAVSLCGTGMSCEVTYDKRLPLLFLYHMGERIDARVATVQSEGFIHKEIFELSRQLGNRESLLEGIKKISLQIDLPADPEIARLFRQEGKMCFPVICNEEDRPLLPADAPHCVFEFGLAETDPVPDREETGAVLIDPFAGADGRETFVGL
ncbi:MAG: AAA family ATPase, partial [Lachnospiraceae bacterium]|nr:AAA family ATPase [Lachnospiraceae bacterium]